MTTHPTLILAKDAHEYETLIQTADLDGLKIETCTSLDQARPFLGECEILFAVPDLAARALAHAPKLKWLQSMWAGITPLLAPDLPRDYTLTGVKGLFGPLMSEYLICHMLMHERKVLFRHQCQQDRTWNQTPPGTLRGKTLGIMGTGSIGTHVAQTAKQFGMTTRGLSRTGSACPHMDQTFITKDILEFAQGLDYLVSILPDTPATDNLVNGDLLAALPERAVFLNVGRGNAVDEEALVAALEKGIIAGAVLDVFKKEPLASDHPLWTAPNTLITAHTAAMSHPEGVAPIFIENYKRYARGEALKYTIDFKAGY
ncbi:MAG: D-2-hydroxyacid dehydrogenase [Desulfobacterales bacterium]|nr:D-2-hydroxyacid dehydrogenase [Desulfobacterales bacterium]